MENKIIAFNKAKKLKALGIKQNGLFYWEEQPESTKFAKIKHRIIEDCHGDAYISNDEGKKENHYSAFMADELEKILPSKIIVRDIKCWFYSDKKDNFHICGYKYKNKKGEIKIISFDLKNNNIPLHSLCKNKADSRARLLCLLTVNDLIWKIF